MSIAENRQCPLCEQIVPITIKGVPVMNAPDKKVVFHPGCIDKIIEAKRRYDEEIAKSSG